MRLLLLTIICISICIIEKSSVYGSSLNLIQSGCTAYDCKRNCFGSDTTQIPGDNGFSIYFHDNKLDKYIPNKTYMVKVMGNQLKNSIMEFRGFLLAAVPANWYDAMPFSPMGKFMIRANDTNIRYSVGCSEMVTHNDFETKPSITVYWTAPPAGSGCVSFKAIVMQSETLWFKDDGLLTKTICEDGSSKENSEIAPCCACGEAKYTFMFKGLWSKFTHPKDWPENEWLTHWSNIIGGVHSRNYTIWEYGGYATPGLKDLAEFGIISTLEEELKNHSRYNYIRNILVANGLWHPNVNNETNSAFSVSNTYHLLTFATMLGPSPDWLTGISKLDLCLPNCTWLDSYTADLYPMDAGTDSGISYNSPNRPTIPQEKIQKITSSFPNNPKSPFFDPTGKSMLPVARVMIKKQLTRGAQCPNGHKMDDKMSETPIDFGLSDYSDPVTRDKMLNENVGSKKKGNKQLHFIDKVDPRCMTSDWSPWTECSSSCGNGIRKRSREYKDPTAAVQGACNEILDDNEMCLSANGDCEDGDNYAFEIKDVCLMVSSWSSWSPCSATCGIGNTVRIRGYLKEGLEKKCNTQLVEQKSCRGNDAKHPKCKKDDSLSADEKKKICMMDKVPGPCQLFMNSTRYYFDRHQNKCMTFEYGGCRGNENNFYTKEACQKMCNVMLEAPSKVMENKPNPSSLMKNKKLCMLPKEEGTCFSSIPRYYFDRTKMMCTPLEYSGCGGNENNFPTMVECQKTCDPIIELIKADSDSMDKMNTQLTIQEKKKICMSPEQVGNCNDAIPRYWYSVNMGKCLLFYYSGCDGNLNNFETPKECEMTCDVLIDMARQAQELEAKSDEEARKKEMCMLPKEIGPCMDYTMRYYFDTSMGKCVSFTFGGCNPNDNNFETLEECEDTCSALIKMTETAKMPKIKMEPSQLTLMERKGICKLPAHEGSCNSYLKRYYFNSFTQQCEPFGYTGCDGNQNNFITFDDCKKTCFEFMNENVRVTSNDSTSMMFHPIDCLLTEWSDWSSCSAMQCGKKGKTMRTREIKVHAQYGGVECSKELNQTQPCMKKCNNAPMTGNGTPVDCVVGQWGYWSECKLMNSCEGFQERSRPIVRKNENGGMDCPKLRERRKCFIGKCDSRKKSIKNI